MKRYSLLLVLANCFVAAAFARSENGEQSIVGKWFLTRHGRGGREIIFHADHTWGVLHYVPDGEDIRGRRWRLAGDKLILTYPGDDGLETGEDQIISFTHDKFVTDGGTYTREK